MGKRGVSAGRGRGLEHNRNMVSEDGTCKPRQQRIQVETADQGKEPAFRNSHHDLIARFDRQLAAEFDHHRLTFQKPSEETCTAAAAGITGRATGHAAKPDQSPAATRGNDPPLLFDHARRGQVVVQGETATTASPI